jgi:hypothetical protein
MKCVFWSLLLTVPLLLPGIYSRGAEAPHNFNEWEPEISAFEKSDLTNPPPRHAILFAGSSTIKFWTTLRQDFPGIPVINRGFGGSEICDSMRRARLFFEPGATI